MRLIKKADMLQRIMNYRESESRCDLHCLNNHFQLVNSYLIKQMTRKECLEYFLFIIEQLFIMYKNNYLSYEKIYNTKINNDCNNLFIRIIEIISECIEDISERNCKIVKNNFKDIGKILDSLVRDEYISYLINTMYCIMECVFLIVDINKFYVSYDNNVDYLENVGYYLFESFSGENDKHILNKILYYGVKITKEKLEDKSLYCLAIFENV